MIAFALVAGMALAILAAIVLLPARQQLRAVRARRDALAAEVQTHERHIAHRERLILASKTHPRLTEDLLIQQRNCRRPGEVVVPTDIPPDPPVAIMLAAKGAASRPVPGPSPAWLDRLTRRVQHPRTRRGLGLLSGLLLVAAMILFAPPQRLRRKRR